MNRHFLLITLALTGFLPVSVSAYVSPGSYQGFVNDFAHVLTVDQIASLEQQVQAYEASTTNWRRRFK